MHPVCELARIYLLPIARVAADEIPATRTAMDACVVGAWRHDPLVAQCACCHRQASAGARDHLIGWRQMLPFVIDNRPHAFGDRLVLQVTTRVAIHLCSSK